jgi:hypothetical protein
MHHHAVTYNVAQQGRTRNLATYSMCATHCEHAVRVSEVVSQGTNVANEMLRNGLCVLPSSAAQPSFHDTTASLAAL